LCRENEWRCIARLKPAGKFAIVFGGAWKECVGVRAQEVCDRGTVQLAASGGFCKRIEHRISGDVLSVFQKRIAPPRDPDFAYGRLADDPADAFDFSHECGKRNQVVAGARRRKERGVVAVDGIGSRTGANGFEICAGLPLIRAPLFRRGIHGTAISAAAILRFSAIRRL
jgi:hypothetical protein